MSEIKAGDRVKVTVTQKPYFIAGDVGVVSVVCHDGTSLVMFDNAHDGKSWYAMTESLVLDESEVQKSVKESLQDEFETWLALNPKFWEMFVLFTNQLMACGATKSSAWLVCNRIRWETALKTQGNPYKISNDFIALLARKFMVEYPEHAGFFTIKTMKRK